jgi:predicted nicotinamide N-methyase
MSLLTHSPLCVCCVVRSLVAGRCVVEVGSGLGLCGLTAAQLCPRHVIISEANDACLHAIHDAIQLNPTTNTSTGTWT